jgi:hypothetical protein
MVALFGYNRPIIGFNLKNKTLVSLPIKELNRVDSIHYDATTGRLYVTGRRGSGGFENVASFVHFHPVCSVDCHCFAS